MAESKDKRETKGQNIPNSSNIFSIISKQFDDITKLSKAISGSSLKPVDIAKIKLSIKMSKFAMKQVVKGYLEIKAYLATQSVNETTDIITNLVSDPVGFFNMIKNPTKMTPSEIKEQKNLKLFESYLKVLKLLGEVSEFGDKITFLGILKLPKKTNMAMSAVMSSLNIVRKYCNKFEPITVATKKFINTVPDVFKILLGMSEKMDKFVAQIAKTSKRKRKKAIKSFFQMYVYLALELFKIGKFLITGNYTFDQEVFGITVKKKKVHYNPVHLILGLYIGSKFLQESRKWLNQVEAVIRRISDIGDAKKSIVVGLSTIQTLFFGSRRILGLPQIISDAPRAKIKHIVSFLLMTATMIPIMATTTVISMMLGVLGANSQNIVSGLLVFDMIFSSGITQKRFLRKATTVPSFVEQLQNISESIDKGLVKNTAKFIGFLALSNVALTFTKMISELISELGSDKKGVKKGLKTFSILFFGKEKFLDTSKRYEGIIGVIESVSNTEDIVLDTIGFISIEMLMNVALNLSAQLANQLFSIGAVGRKAKKGIKTLNYIMFGNLGPGYNLDQPNKKSILGLADLFPRLMEFNLILPTGYFILFSMLTSTAFKYFNNVIDVLVDLGKNARKAKKGIKALNIILFGKEGKRGYKGIIGILTSEELNSLEIKTILVNGAKFILLSGVFFVVGAIMSALGIVAPLVYLAGFAVRIINRIIKRMIKGLTRLEKTNIDIKSSSQKLLEMSTAYIKFVALFASVGKGLNPKEMLKAFALIYLSPIIIRRMIRGLKKIDKNKNIDLIGASKSLTEMALAYTGFAKGIQVIGSVITLSVVLIASAFILVSPIIIRMMIWGLKVLANAKIKTIVTVGSVTLDLMTIAFTGFALGLVAITTIMAGINFVMLVPFIAIVGLMGVMFAMLGLLSPAILLGTAALNVMSVGLIIFSAALLVLSAAIIVFALAFQILRMILPSDDVIDEVVTGVVTLITGVGKIVDALFEKVNPIKAFIGMWAAGFVAVILVLLIVDVVLFIVLGSLSKAITDEMIDSTIRAIETIAEIVDKIYTTVNPIALIASIFIVIGYTILMILLFVTITFTLIVAAIAKTIDYQRLRQNMGLDQETGLIPTLGNIVTAIDESIKFKTVVKALGKITAAMLVMVMLSGIAATIKGLASLEINEYDEEGHPTGKKVLMKENDFQRAQENIQNMMKTVVGIFYNEDGSETETLKLIQSIKGKIVLQATGLKMILSMIGGMSKTIANISKLVVPDETKGFDEKGKPLGWRQLSAQDFDKFYDNTYAMFDAITSIFNDGTPLGSKITQLLNQTTIGSTIKMKLIGMTVGTIGTIASTISKISRLVVPDTSDPNYINEKGEIVKWKQFDSTDMLNMETNISELLLIVGKIIDKIKDSDLENMKMRTIKKFNKAMESMGPISDLIDTIIKMSTGQFAIIDVDKNGYIKPDANGNPVTKYLSFDKIPFDNAATKIQSIVSKYLDKVGGLFSSGKWQNRVKDLNEHMKEGLPTQGISDIVDQVIKLASGQVPMIDTDNDGRPIIDPKTGEPKTRYITINSTVVGDAVTTLKDIISTYVEKLTEMGNNFTNLDTTKVNAILFSANTICRGISPILDSIEKIIKIPSKDIDKFGTDLTKIITGYSVAVGNIQISDFIEWNSGRLAFENFVKASKNLYTELGNQAIPTNTEKTFSATQKFLDKVNGMDAGKLGKMASLAENMAKFSTSINGNFDSLAKAMNENIITALDKVEKSMKDLKEFLEEDFTKNLTNGVSNAVKDIQVTTTGNNNPQPQSGKNKTNDTNVNESPDKKQKEREKALQKELKDMKELANTIRACINSKNQIKVTMT